MTFYYVKCPDNTYRVWLKDWPGDKFEVLSEQEFRQLNAFANLNLFERFAMVIIEHVEE